MSLWCLHALCGFVLRKLKKQAIYPQHLWESQPSYMKEETYLHPREWKTQLYLWPGKVYPMSLILFKMAFVNF